MSFNSEECFVDNKKYNIDEFINNEKLTKK